MPRLEANAWRRPEKCTPLPDPMAARIITPLPDPMVVQIKKEATKMVSFSFIFHLVN